MLKNRRLMLVLGGTGLMLAACAQPSPPPPPPPAPVAAPAPPPAPDFSGVYQGRIAWSHGCHIVTHASMTVQGTTFNLPLNKFYTFNGPVNPDGTLSATVEAVPPTHGSKGGRPGGELNGQITGNLFHGTMMIGKCSARITLQKAAASS